MRPFGTSQQLARRRQRALNLLHQGHTPTAIAQQVGATPQTVCRWHRESKHPRRKAKRNPGCPSRLSVAQLQRLLSALKRGAYAQSYAEARTRRSQSRLWACIHASELPWRRKPK